MRTLISVVCFIAFPTIIFLSLIYQHQVFDLIGEFAEVKVLGGKTQNVTQVDSEHDSSQLADISDDKLLGGLLASGFNQESCLSRYQSALYHKTLPHKPSPYLLSKLRNYENLHKNCGPYTESYNRTLKLLESYNTTLKALTSVNISSPTECNYIVWTALEGLGNRILTMSSAFLYALLTNRVLLVEHKSDMADLFCEPFPNTSWLLPQDFPLKNEFKRLNKLFPDRYGNMVKNNIINVSTVSPSPIPSLVYLFLAFNCDDFDKHFYCEDHQTFLQKVPWLILKTDQYFTPFLFLIPSFEQELDKMFPDKETIFHFFGRYLFQPSNKAWGLITRFYQSYLGKADQIIGMQIRIFNPKASPFQIVIDQILACTQQENLLPELDEQNFIANSPMKNQTSKAILIASLYSEFYENIKDMYWKFPTITGEVIGVYQPNHEQYQHYDDNMHNLKAWVEINLLSLSDVLVTSSWSTFGYVAQGLGGLKPWILYKPEDWKNFNQACRPAMSKEPCFHFPPSFDCKTMVKVDMGTVVPHIKHCEDEPSGIKLVNNYNSSSN